jgi:putative intracellular protease/amidase
MATNTILFVVASEGYQSVEYSVPKKLLEQAGFVVLTASDAPGTAVAKDDASTTDVNLLVSDAIIENYVGVFFIGGSGALEHLDNENSYRLINDTLEAN